MRDYCCIVAAEGGECCCADETVLALAELLAIDWCRAHKVDYESFTYDHETKELRVRARCRKPIEFITIKGEVAP